MQKTRHMKKHLRETANQQKLFRQDPWKFGIEVFKPKNAGKPTFDVEAAEKHFISTYVDAERNKKYTFIFYFSVNVFSGNHHIDYFWRGLGGVVFGGSAQEPKKKVSK